MSSSSIFELAGNRMQWLAARQAAIAGNVANADTPGYRAMDVQPFQSLLGDGGSLAMVSTSPLHFADASAGAPQPTLRPEKDAWDAAITGNTVSIDQEMAKAGETTNQFSLATGVMRSLQNLWLTAAKG